MEKINYQEEIKQAKVSEVHKDILSQKIAKIYNEIALYEKQFPKEMKYINQVFNERLQAISNLQDNANALKFLSKDELLKLWIVEVSEWDTASGKLYKYNIDPNKAFVDWNTTLNVWKTEFLKTETTMILRLKDLENQWVLEFWADNIPKIKWELSFDKQLEVLDVIKDYANYKAQNWQETQKYSQILQKVSALEYQYSQSVERSIREQASKITKKDVADYKNNLIYSINHSSNISAWEKVWMVKEIENWFNDPYVDVELKIVAVSLTVAWTLIWWWIMVKALASLWIKDAMFWSLIKFNNAAINVAVWGAWSVIWFNFLSMNAKSMMN